MLKVINIQAKQILDVYYLILLTYTFYTEETFGFKKMKLNNIVLLTCFLERI